MVPDVKRWWNYLLWESGAELLHSACVCDRGIDRRIWGKTIVHQTILPNIAYLKKVILSNAVAYRYGWGGKKPNFWLIIIRNTVKLV